MNTGVKHLLRNKRQREGRRPQQPHYPPGEWGLDLLPGFAYTYRGEGDPFGHGGEQQQRTNLFFPPAFAPNDLEDETHANQFLAESMDKSNPPDSNLYAEGKKIQPWAKARSGTAGYLAMAEWEQTLDEFPWNGRKLEALGINVPQQIGGQHSIDVTPLIPEAEWTTYGAMNTLVPGQVAEDGYLYA